jgi:hypothetical protein
MHPHDLFLAAQKLKYKFLLMPGAIIVVNFLLARNYPDLKLKYLSILALLLYIFVLVIFRFQRAFAPEDEDMVTAPINGVITKIDTGDSGSILYIKKGFFASSELVTCTLTDIPNEIDPDQPFVSWIIPDFYTSSFTRNLGRIFIESTFNHQRSLVGLVPGIANCELFIPDKYEIVAKVGTKIIAGVTPVAERK